MRKGRKSVLLAAIVMTMAGAFAFQPVPKASGKALGVTRTKSFSKGLVFVNGKFLPPPYVVERWGTGIRINSKPVTGQVIDWDEFLKTQPNVKAERKNVEVVSTELVVVRPEQPEESAAQGSDEVDLDDLFDDEDVGSVGEEEEKKEAPKEPETSVVRQEVKRNKTVVTYTIDGEFVPNDASKALLSKINARRTEIDKALRADGFVFFGDGYPPFVGNAHMMQDLIRALPDHMRTAKGEKDFRAKMKASGLGYLGANIIRDLYRNHIDYPKLQKYRTRVASGAELDPSLKELAKPIF